MSALHEWLGTFELECPNLFYFVIPGNEISRFFVRSGLFFYLKNPPDLEGLVQIGKVLD